ncbi:DNA-directed RNA polymerase I subunit RPA2-like [Gigantopelta aegis]|uniref:DNA-directed RNA polymerase I subunit RPA2-like n=1 Tax=Gigantopelta aegis TaxID=1735272 RepID=UPI001B88DA7C|nr:DNA-directed RNA polymerase I subunit RPA2-like [Gigantopelta aegis]
MTSLDAAKPSLKNLQNPDYGVPEKHHYGMLHELTRPHIDSFNYMLHEGLAKAVQSIPPVQFALPNGDRVSLILADATIQPPMVSEKNEFASTLKVFPAECRERGVTYSGSLQLQVTCMVNDSVMSTVTQVASNLPVMVKSDICNLANMSPAELVKHKEEAHEMGGYFIINGNERILRMIIMPRRNYPLCIDRQSWKTRGKQFTKYGITMHCVRTDQSGLNMFLHYLANGTATLGITFEKQLFYIPVVFVLKALMDVTDKFLYEELIAGKESDSFYKGQCVCCHLDSDLDKFNLLVYMTKKLFAFAKGECAAESADNPMNQELLLGGHLYLMVLKERLHGYLNTLRMTILRSARSQSESASFDSGSFRKIFNVNRSSGAKEISRALEYLLATGNLNSKSGLGLMQISGLSVLADKLNFLRYISHFRCVHRGAFFAEMRTTTVRKLRPEAWGFLCPVHTPDGGLCGLVNHLAALCQTCNVSYNTGPLVSLLTSLGMCPCGAPIPVGQSYTVLLDGRVVGYISSSIVVEVAERLRTMKVKSVNNVSRFMEICLVLKTDCASQYPGLYLFTSLARMIRPVKNLAMNQVEYIGCFEQVYLDIAVSDSDIKPGITTHKEMSPSAMLSTVATFTPFSDFNQSPRNMYQCQMGKQTLGTPCHALQHRGDNKLYRIQTPQSPITRPVSHDVYQVDNYPLGTNAVVAVISYTGYDMEDAMVINKGSLERGFAHASVYKTEIVDLSLLNKEAGSSSLVFGCRLGHKDTDGKLDIDGLPPVGKYLNEGDPFYSYINLQTGEVKVQRYKSQEPAYVDQIKILGNDFGTGEMQRVRFVLRIQRNPIIGDKFASRHGQKGICSIMWPSEDLPFTESGMVPDIIFNPHGYPSRMTIGMMIESMANKSAALHGLCFDASPFTFSEDQPAIDYFGKTLTAAGYNYYGTERLYSGVDGRELEADIFFGIVYYQRLRHMVSDKFQVRSTGPIDQLTHQPVKGRKRMGGVRFGEMERDALLAHGAVFMLHDRLLNCSDKSYTRICTDCGNILSPLLEKPAVAVAAISAESHRVWACQLCRRTDKMKMIAVPYVYQYLVAELAAMSINLVIEVK